MPIHQAHRGSFTVSWVLWGPAGGMEGGREGVEVACEFCGSAISAVCGLRLQVVVAISISTSVAFFSGVLTKSDGVGWSWHAEIGFRYLVALLLSC